MPQVSNILVPLETHENAVPVLQWATLLAQATRSRLTLLHVNESLELVKTRPGLQGGGYSGIDSTVEKWRHQYEQNARSMLDQFAQQYCAGVSAALLLLDGRAHATILEALETTASDLVIMGTHGRPWYQRAFLGSTAESVLRASPVPVLIVRNTVPSPPPRLRCLLFSTDFSAASAAGEEWVRYLTQHGIEEAILLHAVENPLLDVYAPDTVEIDIKREMEEARQHPPRSAKPFWDHARQFARTKLSQLRQQLLGPPFGVSRIEIDIGEGSAAQVILTAAEQQCADMIVMATHGYTGVRRFILGSVTEKVIRAAACPVLVVPSRET